VPYYEPEQVVIYQPRPVYYYYPRAYPVYYYPYPSYYSFHDHFYHDHFWGVTTAFAIGWHSYHLNTFHHSFYGHPYYGYSYRDRWWYRRPDIHVYNNTYVSRNVNVSYNRYHEGDHWAPRERRTVRQSDQRITRTRYYPSSDSRSSVSTNTRTYTNRNSSGQVARSTTSAVTKSNVQRRIEADPIKFRDRQSTNRVSRSGNSAPLVARSDNTRKSSSAITARPSTRRNEVARQPEPRYVAPSKSSSPMRSGSASRASSRPEAAPQRSPQPRASQPRASQPRASQPRASQPRASQPRASQPRASQPRASQSRSSQSSNRPSRTESRGSGRDRSRRDR
jgi:hypothetical protein